MMLTIAASVALCASSPAADKGSAQIVTVENRVEAAPPKGTFGPAQAGEVLATGAQVRTGALSRATVRLTSQSVLRVNERSTLTILPPDATYSQPGLDLLQGAALILSREKPAQLRIRTPVANGILQGTELQVQVGANGTTRMVTLDGRVDLSNQFGRVTLGRGEQGIVEPGHAPRKTAVIDARNKIQWSLYYPGVLYLPELGISARTGGSLRASVAAYEAGDLLAALKALPVGGDAPEYHAAVLLSVGQVERARALLASAPAETKGKFALERMIAAVTLEGGSTAFFPRTAGDWVAEAYFRQAHSDLEGALAAARRATELAPNFGFAWARLAELEFSFGHTSAAKHDVETALRLTPRNSHALAMSGFLASAESRPGEARRHFQEAIEIDPALGEAWLGRGLTEIKAARYEAGRLDLQTAAALEPTHSIYSSYYGKALTDFGFVEEARHELDWARELDPRDPTPWLYSALLHDSVNEINQAVRDLEKSQELNDNRSVYRSRLLLDSDAAVRGANLAAIYERDGMRDVSLREASEAVIRDYSNASAHLFLSNSYNELRDPRSSSRFDSPWFNELLIANLLAPVGAGPLSQYISNQEYSRLFESNRFGASTDATYYSTGEYRVVSSLYGIYDRVSFSLDEDYRFSNGLRPNNDFTSLETFAKFKFELTPADTLFFQAEVTRFDSGFIEQIYDPHDVSRKTLFPVGNQEKLFHDPGFNYRERERGEPELLLAGLHHHWSPGVDTLLLLGRVDSNEMERADEFAPDVLVHEIPGRANPQQGFPAALLDRGRVLGLYTNPLDPQFQLQLKVYTVEINQIWETDRNTLVAGTRYQNGTFTPAAVLSGHPVVNFSDTFAEVPTRTSYDATFNRITSYLYDTYRIGGGLSVTAGVTYDKKEFPGGYTTYPLVKLDRSRELLSPKGGLNWDLPWHLNLRAAYAQSLGGAYFDERIRLEPARVAGFNQTVNGFVAQSLSSPLTAPKNEVIGVVLSQKLPTQTYWGIEAQQYKTEADQVLGAFATGLDPLTGGFVTPDPRADSLLSETNLVGGVHYKEQVLRATVNQLVGRDWSFGTGYQYTQSELVTDFPTLASGVHDAHALTPDDLARNVRAKDTGQLHEAFFSVNWNHPSGWFGVAEAHWYHQDSDHFEDQLASQETLGNGRAHNTFRTKNIGLPGDDFWQINLRAGYRFWQNRGELSVGVLNLGDHDYRLNPVNYYAELPRVRTFFVNCRLNY